MNFLERFWTKAISQRGEQRSAAQSSTATTVYQGNKRVVSVNESLTLSTVYACVDRISDGVAQLPLYPYTYNNKGQRVIARDDDSFEMLSAFPNGQMTRFTLLKTVVISILLRGNGYIRVERGADGNATALYFWHPDDTIVFYHEGDNGRQVEFYYNARTDTVVLPDDMIHVLNFTLDGVEGISTIKHAMSTLSLSKASEDQAGGFFNGTGSLKGILTTKSGRLNDDKRQQIREEWARQMRSNSPASDGVAILDQDLEYSAISVSPQDAQLLESRKFNVAEICRFFKISPALVGDPNHTSYATSEAANIAFLIDTLQPYLVKIELEFRRKIYAPQKRKQMEVDFDTRALIRADSTGQANLYRTLFSIGAVTPNEVRSVFNYPPVEGGDDVFVQVNMAKAKDFATAKQKQQDTTEK